MPGRPLSDPRRSVDQSMTTVAKVIIIRPKVLVDRHYEQLEFSKWYLMNLIANNLAILKPDDANTPLQFWLYAEKKTILSRQQRENPVDRDVFRIYSCSYTTVSCKISFLF